MNSSEQNGQQTLGTWLSIGSPVVAELAAESGFGWLLFDLEHGCASDGALFGQLQATRGSTARKIVRVGAPHPDLIARMLDWGADGIMVPHVNSAEEAERCVQAMSYPPRGHRGFSRTVRAYGYGLRAPGEGELPPAPKFLAQIESVEGVEHSAEIATVPGVDVLFVGPADLRFDLAARKSDRRYEDCLAAVVQAARAAGKEAGILVRDVKDLPSLKEQGFTWLAIDSDLAILRERYRQIVGLV